VSYFHRLGVARPQGGGEPRVFARTPSTVIETERLLLRKPCVDDVEPMCALWADPAVVKYITGEALTRRRAWSGLMTMAGHWEMYGYGGWVAVDKHTGAFVGQVGFQQFFRQIDAELDHLPEAGWVLSPHAHGRGYASEAMRAAIVWADANIDAARTVAIVQVENAASLRVAEKMGYRELRRMMYLDAPIVLLERARP
jgi:RimJ/RimL family protein N-acetyltransferase